MNDNTAKPAEIHVVTIDLAPGSSPPVEAKSAKFYVRHNTPASARNWLLENSVDARKATQADIVAMCKAGIEPIGLADPDKPYPPRAPTRENHVDD